MRKNKSKFQFLLIFFIFVLLPISSLIENNINNSRISEIAELNYEEHSFSLKSSGIINTSYFNYYKEITIDCSKVEEELINFPLLISIDDTDLHTEVQPDGDDIAFYNGSDWLDYEIELFKQDYDETHARLVAWVKIPLLSNSTDTKIYMYYGNTTMETQQNSIAVWTSNYKGVWHLNTTLLDSTSNNNDGINYGADDVSSHIANGRAYNGIDDSSDMSSDPSLGNIFNGGGTISAWIYPKGWGGADYGRILAKSSLPDGSNGWVMCVDGEASPAANHHLLFFRGFDVERGLWYTPEDSISLNQWQYIVVTYDDTSKDYVPSIYINGEPQSPLVPEPSPKGSAVNDTTQSVFIGNYEVDGNRAFNGSIDEVRISSVDHSYGWILTEYRNQNDPDSFYNVSAAISLDTTPPNVKINLPNQNNLFGSTAPNFNVSINDNHVIDKMWYRLLNGTIITINTTFTTNGTIDEARWAEMGNGTVTIQFFANDSNGNIGYSEVVVRKDIIFPAIVINSPSNFDLFGSIPPSYNVEIWDPNGVNITWYTLNNGIETYFNDNGTISQSPWSLCGNGTVSIKFYANDSLGNEGFSEVIVRKEIESPNITIHSPINFALFGKIAPNFTVEIGDRNGVNTTWYTLNNDKDIPFTENGTILQSEWDLWGNGTVSIKFYANNSLGNTDFEEIVVRKDVIGPVITISTPDHGDLLGRNAPSFNVIITDPNGIDTKWYTIDEGMTNITFTENGVINQALWELRGNGTVTIRFYANDSLGNEGYSEVYVYKDIIGPTIVINSPNPYDIFGAIAPNFNITTIDSSNIITRWYTIDNGITNITCGTTGQIHQTLWGFQPNGTVSIKFFAKDSFDNIGFSEVIVRKDIDPPSIKINSPTLNQIFGETAPAFNVEITDFNGINTTWYSLDGGLTNKVFIANETINQTIWNTYGDGNINLRFYANNSLGTIGFSEINIIKDMYAPSLTINTPSNNSYWNHAPTLNIYSYDISFDKLWIRVGSTNVSITSDVNFPLNSSIWNNLSQGLFQIYIYANDTLGHLNTKMLNLYKDTISPSAPFLLIAPTGEVSIPITFDWEEVFDASGIAYYRLIIDNEADPFSTPGYTFEVNISSTSSYYELTEFLLPRNYYYFIYSVDGAGNQGMAASGTFIISGSSSNPTKFPSWIIYVIIAVIVASVVGSISVITIVRRKSHKKLGPPKKKVLFKIMLGHLEKLSPPKLTMGEIQLQNTLIQKERDQDYSENLPDEIDVEIIVDEIKVLGEELFSEGAYLEAVKQFQQAKDLLSKNGRNEDAALFSDLIEGIEGLIQERENRFGLLENEKIGGEAVKIFELYYDIIEISKRLRDLDAISMFRSELIQYFQINKFKLVDIENYRLNLEHEADSLSDNRYFELAAQIYGKCEEISQLLVKLGKEEEMANVENFRNKKNECLEKFS